MLLCADMRAHKLLMLAAALMSVVLTLRVQRVAAVTSCAPPMDLCKIPVYDPVADNCANTLDVVCPTSRFDRVNRCNPGTGHCEATDSINGSLRVLNYNIKMMMPMFSPDADARMGAILDALAPAPGQEPPFDVIVFNEVWDFCFDYPEQLVDGFDGHPGLRANYPYVYVNPTPRDIDLQDLACSFIPPLLAEFICSNAPPPPKHGLIIASRYEIVGQEQMAYSMANGDDAEVQKGAMKVHVKVPLLPDDLSGDPRYALHSLVTVIGTHLQNDEGVHGQSVFSAVSSCSEFILPPLGPLIKEYLLCPNDKSLVDRWVRLPDIAIECFLDVVGIIANFIGDLFGGRSEDEIAREDTIPSQLNELTDFALTHATGDPIILAGDFNTSPATSYYGDMLNQLQRFLPEVFPWTDVWSWAPAGQQPGYTSNAQEGLTKRIDFQFLHNTLQKSLISAFNVRTWAAYWGGGHASDHVGVAADYVVGPTELRSRAWCLEDAIWLTDPDTGVRMLPDQLPAAFAEWNRHAIFRLVWVPDDDPRCELRFRWEALPLAQRPVLVGPDNVRRIGRAITLHSDADSYRIGDASSGVPLPPGKYSMRRVMLYATGLALGLSPAPGTGGALDPLLLQTQATLPAITDADKDQLRDLYGLRPASRPQLPTGLWADVQAALASANDQLVQNSLFGVPWSGVDRRNLKLQISFVSAALHADMDGDIGISIPCGVRKWFKIKWCPIKILDREEPYWYFNARAYLNVGAEGCVPPLVWRGGQCEVPGAYVSSRFEPGLGVPGQSWTVSGASVVFSADSVGVSSETWQDWIETGFRVYFHMVGWEEDGGLRGSDDYGGAADATRYVSIDAQDDGAPWSVSHSAGLNGGAMSAVATTGLFLDGPIQAELNQLWRDEANRRVTEAQRKSVLASDATTTTWTSETQPAMATLDEETAGAPLSQVEDQVMAMVAATLDSLELKVGSLHDELIKHILNVFRTSHPTPGADELTDYLETLQTWLMDNVHRRIGRLISEVASSSSASSRSMQRVASYYEPRDCSSNSTAPTRAVAFKLPSRVVNTAARKAGKLGNGQDLKTSLAQAWPQDSDYAGASMLVTEQQFNVNLDSVVRDLLQVPPGEPTPPLDQAAELPLEPELETVVEEVTRSSILVADLLSFLSGNFTANAGEPGITVEAVAPQGVPRDDAGIDSVLSLWLAELQDVPGVMHVSMHGGNDGTRAWWPIGRTSVRYVAEWSNELIDATSIDVTVRVVDTLSPELLVTPRPVLVQPNQIASASGPAALTQIWQDSLLVQDVADPAPSVTWVPRRSSSLALGTHHFAAYVVDAAGNPGRLPDGHLRVNVTAHVAPTYFSVYGVERVTIQQGTIVDGNVGSYEGNGASSEVVLSGAQLESLNSTVWTPRLVVQSPQPHADLRYSASIGECVDEAETPPRNCSDILAGTVVQRAAAPVVSPLIGDDGQHDPASHRIVPDASAPLLGTVYTGRSKGQCKNADVCLGAGDVLPPGKYSSVRAQRQKSGPSYLRLGPGRYEITHVLDLDPGVTLLAASTANDGGRTDIVFGADASLVLGPSTRIDTAMPSDAESIGPALWFAPPAVPGAVIDLGPNTDLRMTVYAPERRVRVFHATTLTGAVLALEVEVKPGAVVQADPFRCDAGRWLDNWAWSLRPLGHCTSCRTHTARRSNDAVVGEQFCASCAPGTQANAAQDACDACPAGWVQPTAVHARSCHQCPAGTIAPTPGLSRCQPCPRGTVANDQRTVCLACGQGTAPEGTSAADSPDDCLPCLGGAATPAGSGVCMPDILSTSHGACVDSLCVCDDGYVGAQCDACRPGRFGSECESCPDCGIGGECDEGIDGSGQCLCFPGFNGDRCQFCDAGHYGQHCLPCTVDCNSHGQCQDGRTGSGACVCDAVWDGDVCDQCISGHFGAECQACPVCPENSVCDDGVQGSGLCSCATGWVGSNCDMCDDNYYGTNCTLCTANCPNAECDDGIDGTGECVCRDGFDPLDDCGDCLPGLFGMDCTGVCDACGEDIGGGRCAWGQLGNGTCLCNLVYDPALNCADCRPSWYGPNCSLPVMCDNCTINQVCDYGLNGTGSCVNATLASAAFAAYPEAHGMVTVAAVACAAAVLALVAAARVLALRRGASAPTGDAGDGPGAPADVPSISVTAAPAEAVPSQAASSERRRHRSSSNAGRRRHVSSKLEQHARVSPSLPSRSRSRVARAVTPRG